jgi:hypothetical protein
MPKKSSPLNLEDFDAIDWDPEDDPTGNHAHCAKHGVDERVVYEVLNGDWVDIEMEVETAEFAIVGPNEKKNFMWTLLFDTSWKRGDLLRPVTGWVLGLKRSGNGKERQGKNGKGQGKGEGGEDEQRKA